MCFFTSSGWLIYVALILLMLPPKRLSRMLSNTHPKSSDLYLHVRVCQFCSMIEEVKLGFQLIKSIFVWIYLDFHLIFSHWMVKASHGWSSPSDPTRHSQHCINSQAGPKPSPTLSVITTTHDVTADLRNKPIVKVGIQINLKPDKVCTLVKPEKARTTSTYSTTRTTTTKSTLWYWF